MNMQGFQITFFTGEGRRHGHQPMGAWLMETVRQLGIHGATLSTGVEGIGRDGHLHSAHFFELADQPVTLTLVVTENQWAHLAQTLTQAQADVFYVKVAAEFGVLGGSGPDATPAAAG
jgi:PII-like signaling protein